MDPDIAPTQDYQRECIQRFITGIQLENESYLLRHPEIIQMLTSLFDKMTHQQPKPKDVLKKVALYIIKHIMNEETRILSMLPVNEPDVSVFLKELFEHDGLKKFRYENTSEDLMDVASVKISSSDTNTSSFMSILTSESTLVSPEPTMSLEQTSSEMVKSVISQIVNKAVYCQVTEEDIQYDTAYVELKKAVEVAMEIPVLGIRQDLADLIKMAYYMFELRIEESKRIAAQNTWETRIKKKWKRKLRRYQNFKGYETQPTAKSEISPREDFIDSCKYSSQYQYNRYPKDRFGIYLPQETAFSNESVTAAIAVEEIEPNEHNNIDIDSTSQKSSASYKSGVILSTYIIDGNKKMNFMIKRKNYLRDDDKDGVSKKTSANVILFKPSHKLFWKR